MKTHFKHRFARTVFIAIMLSAFIVRGSVQAADCEKNYQKRIGRLAEETRRLIVVLASHSDKKTVLGEACRLMEPKFKAAYASYFQCVAGQPVPVPIRRGAKKSPRH